MSTQIEHDAPPAIETQEPGQVVCDFLFKSIGDRLQHMTKNQYRIYGKLLGEMSAVMNGQGEIAENEGQDAAWQKLSRRARGLLLAIEANGPEADTSPYSSYDDTSMTQQDAWEVSDDDALQHAEEKAA